MSPIAKRLVAPLMDGLDLLIDFATLGEYGLEELPADGPGGGKTGGAGLASLTPQGGASPIGWEVLAPARRSSLQLAPLIATGGQPPSGRSPIQ